VLRRSSGSQWLSARVVLGLLMCLVAFVCVVGVVVDVRLLVRNADCCCNLSLTTRTQYGVKRANANASVPVKPARILYLMYSTPSLAFRMATNRFTWMQHLGSESRVLFLSDFPMPCEVPDALQVDTQNVTKTDPVFNLGYKELRAWEHVIDNDTLLDSFDWFYKVDDDSYVLPQNVERLVSRFDRRSIHYLGRNFKLAGEKTFTPGGPGYILSWATLQRLKRNPFRAGPEDDKWTFKCKPFFGLASDTAIGECLRRFGITPNQAWGVDDGERELFWPFHEQASFQLSGTGWWYGDYAWYGHRNGRECCSNDLVAFHFMDDLHAVPLEFLLYGLRPVIRRNSTMSALLRGPYDRRGDVFCWAFRQVIDTLGWKLAIDSPPIDDTYCRQGAHNQTIFLRFQPIVYPTRWCPSAPTSNLTAVRFPGNSWCGPLSEQRIEAWRCVDFHVDYQRQLRMLLASGHPANFESEFWMANYLVNELHVERDEVL